MFKFSLWEKIGKEINTPENIALEVNVKNKVYLGYVREDLLQMF